MGHIFIVVKRHVTLPSPNNCRLYQLSLESSHYANLSAPSVHALSAHGKLEYVVFIVRSITTSAITTLIDNSPNLILLCVVLRSHCVMRVVLVWHGKNTWMQYRRCSLTTSC